MYEQQVFEKVENHLIAYCPICKNSGYSQERKSNARIVVEKGKKNAS